MKCIALTIHNDKIKQEIFDFLKKFPDGEVELMSIEDAEGLQLLQRTRHEETVSLSDYLKNAN